MNEHWIVKDCRNGKVICHCADINDAIMMVNFDSDHRSYSRHRFLSDQVITVSYSVDKALSEKKIIQTTPILDFHKERLPEGQGNPVII